MKFRWDDLLLYFFKLVITHKPKMHNTCLIRFLWCLNREEHPDLVESMAKKGSNVPEKPKTPQQLWYNHEKKAFLKLHPDVSLAAQQNRMQLLAAFRDFNFFCVSPRRPPKTLKIVLANSGRSFLTKRGSNGSPSRWNSRSSMRWDKNQCVVALDDKRWQKKIIFNWGFFAIFQETMREYIQQHPELNMTQEDIVKSTLTKAERHLKDKSDGRPDKPPPWVTATNTLLREGVTALARYLVLTCGVWMLSETVTRCSVRS